MRNAPLDRRATRPREPRKLLVVVSSLVAGVILLTLGVLLLYQGTKLRRAHDHSQSEPRDGPSSPHIDPDNPIAAATPDMDSVSTEALLKQLFEVSRKEPVDADRLAQIHRALVTRGEAAARALIAFLLQDPTALDVKVFYQEVSRLLVELGESSTVELYIAAIPKIEMKLLAQGNDWKKQRPYVQFLKLILFAISETATDRHVTLLIQVFSRLSHEQAKVGLVRLIGMLKKRFNNPEIRSFLVGLLYKDPDSRVRIAAARILAAGDNPEALAGFITRLMKLSSLDKSPSYTEITVLARGILNAVNPSEALTILESAIRDSQNQATPQMVGRAIAEAYNKGQFTDIGPVLERVTGTPNTTDQVMYLSVLQRVNSDDPRIIESLKGIRTTPLAPLPHTMLMFAVGKKGTGDDLIDFAEGAVETRLQNVVGSAALSMHLYILRHPEDTHLRDAIVKYARHDDPKVRIPFVMYMKQLSATSPNFFEDVLKDIAKNDSDPNVRRVATDALKNQP